MKKTHAIIAYLLISLIFISCDAVVQYEVGNGEITTEEIGVDDFDEIKIDGNFKIYLKQGDHAGVSVITDENLQEFIKVQVKENRLIIETTERISSDEGINVNITFNKLTKIDVSGAATINNEGVIKGDFLLVEMSGAGAIQLAVDLKALQATIAGAGAIRTQGFAKEQKIKMNGAGGYDGYDLQSENCIIDISGVGSAKLYVTNSLNAEVAGVGGIKYRGNPDDVQTEVSGLGSIERDTTIKKDSL